MSGAATPDDGGTPARPRAAPPARPRAALPARPRAALPARPRAAPPARPRAAPPARPRAALPARPRAALSAPRTARERLRHRLVGDARGDAGSVTLLSIAFGALALLLLTAVASATSIHLEQKRLVALADELALEAADALDLAAFYRGEAAAPTEAGVVPLTDADVRRAVEEHLTDHPGVADGLEAFAVVEAVSDDGRTARVSLAALVRPALISWVTAAWSDGIALRATSSARAW